MIYKKITDDKQRKTFIECFNDSEGFHLRVECNEERNETKEVFLLLNNIESLEELKKDIEKQLNFQKSLLKTI